MSAFYVVITEHRKNDLTNQITFPQLFGLYFIEQFQVVVYCAIEIMSTTTCNFAFCIMM